MSRKPQSSGPFGSYQTGFSEVFPWPLHRLPHPLPVHTEFSGYSQKGHAIYPTCQYKADCNTLVRTGWRTFQTGFGNQRVPAWVQRHICVKAGYFWQSSCHSLYPGAFYPGSYSKRITSNLELLLYHKQLGNKWTLQNANRLRSPSSPGGQVLFLRTNRVQQLISSGQITLDVHYSFKWYTGASLLGRIF